MSDIGKQALKTKINSKVYENSSQAITGAAMNEVLQDMVDTLCDGANLDAGSVTDSRLQNPVSVSQNTETGGQDIKIGDDLYGVQDSKTLVKSFIRKVKGGSIHFTPTNFYGSADRFSVELKFRMPSDTTTLGFLFAWMTDEQWSGCYISQNKIFTYYKGVEKSYRDITGLGGQDCVITMSFDSSLSNATSWILNGSTSLLSYNIPSADNRFDSDVYLGSYTEGTSDCLADFYYFAIASDVYEVFNAATITNNASNVYVDGKLLINNSTSFAEYIAANDNCLHGNILLSGSVTVPNNTHLRGNNCVISFASVTAEMILGDDSSIEGVSFNGGSPYTRQNKYEADPTLDPEYRYDLVPVISTNDVINFDTRFNNGRAFIKLNGKNASVINCTFFDNYNFTAAVRTIYDNTSYDGTQQTSIINCHFNDCMCAIDNRSEFTRIIGCEFKNCPIGLYAYAGNLDLSACHFIRNDIAIALANSGNSGHSQYSGIEVAHCGIAGLYSIFLGYRVGLMITGGQFADAPLFGKFGGLGLVGCRIDSWFRFDSPGENEKTGLSNFAHDCAFDLSTVKRDYGVTSSDPATALGLDYLFQMSEGTTLDLKNNISLNPTYLPLNRINN